MTCSLAIHFSAAPKYMRYRALDNAPHRRYLAEFGYGLRVKRKKKYLYIRKYNNITNNYKKGNSGGKRFVQSYKYPLNKVSLPN